MFGDNNMIYADTIIENNSLFLINLNNNSNNTELDKWSSGTGYGFYHVNYFYPLAYKHYYY